MITIGFVHFLIGIFGSLAAIDVAAPHRPSLSPRHDPRYPRDIREASLPMRARREPSLVEERLRDPVRAARRARAQARR